MRSEALEPVGTVGELPSRRSIVRRGTVDDLPTLLRGAQALFNEAGFKGTFNPSFFLSQLEALMKSGIGVLFLLELDGKAIGAMFGIVCPNIYTGERCLVQMFLDVLLEFRGSGMNGIRLIKAFEAFAEEQGIEPDQVSINHLATWNPEQMNKLFVRIGYCPAEVHYQKRLLWARRS